MSSRKLIFGLLVLMLAACQSTPRTTLDTPAETQVVQPNDISSSTQEVKATIPVQDTEVPATDVPPTVPPTEAPAPTAAPFSMTPPDGWYVTHTQVDNLQATICINQDPENLQVSSEDAFPPGFAAIALVTSPMPSGSNAEAMVAGMEDALSSYRSEDLRGMLMAAEKIGLIDLTNAENVSLDKVKIDELGGYPALVMNGTLQFPNGSSQMKTQVWLTWVEQTFVVFYKFTGANDWDTMQPIFNTARDSINLP
jgi:hypothetical protein